MVAYKLQPLSVRDVTINSGFWSRKIKVNQEVTLPHLYDRFDETGRIDAFDLNSEAGTKPVIWWDSEVARWLEGACYSLMTNPDPELGYVVERLVKKIISAQQPDGYVNTFISLEKPDLRWKNLGQWHELFNAGHLIEAAIAHYEATGKGHFLEAMRRYADYIDSVFGPGKRNGYPGHQEIELALVRLYQVTKDNRYLKLGQFFLDERGGKPSVFETELEDLASEDARLNRHYFLRTGTFDSSEFQDHLPVREQATAVGHAVRATNMYAGMIDVGVATDDQSLIDACLRLWDDVYNHKMYITGGIGARGEIEGFGEAYELPNDTAYAETCAAIGSMLWNHRLFNLFADVRYMDVIERTLYNGLLSGVSVDGRRFFYDNPLASSGEHHRREWFYCACCPPNIARLIASVGQLVYAQAPGEAYVNLYMGGTGRIDLRTQILILRQHTDYPWDGSVQIEVHPEKIEEFTINLRLPDWCHGYDLQVNGKPIDGLALDKGYLGLKRTWQPGDVIELDLDMPIVRMYAHPKVPGNVGKVALQRGPIVYCLEGVDHPTALERIVLPKESQLQASHVDDETLGHIVQIQGDALMLVSDDWQGVLYKDRPPTTTPISIKAIPYFAWDNRQPGEMRVWINEFDR